MTAHAFILELGSAAVAAEARVNDWLACRATDPEPRISQVKLNPWLIEGPNSVELRASPLDAAPLAPGARLWLRLYKAEHRRALGDEDRLFAFRWTSDEGLLRHGGLTRVFSHAIRIPSALGRWAWQDASPYMPADRAAIAELVSRFHGALAQRDVASAMSMLALKTEEMSRSVGASASESEQWQRAMLQEYFRHDDWQLAPLDLSSLVLESSAGGRLVSVRGPGGTSPITGGATALPAFAYDFAVTNVRGRWVIAR